MELIVSSPLSLLAIGSRPSARIRCAATCTDTNISVLTNGAPSRNSQQQLLLDQLSLELQREKDKRIFAPSVRVLFSFLSSVQEINQVDALLRGLHFPLPVFSTVIRKLGSSQHIQAAFSVYEWLHTKEIPEERPDVFIYSSMLGVVQRTGKLEFLKQVVDQMKINGVEPDLIAYKIIISCYENMGLHNEAMTTLTDIEKKGLRLDVRTLKHLLKGCEKCSDIDGALVLYNAIMKSDNASAASGNDVSNSNSVVETAEEAEVKSIVSGIAFRTVRRMLFSQQNSFHILELIERVEHAIGSLCPADYQGIIWACGQGPEDYIIAHKMLSSNRLDIQLVSVALCNHVIKLLGKAKRWELALEVLCRMLNEGPCPDNDSISIIRCHFNSVLISSREMGKSDSILHILERMEDHGVIPDRFAWDTALVTCAKRPDPDTAVLVFERMVERGQVPSILAYGSLLTSLEKCSLFDKAEQVWKHMQKLQIKPNIEVYTIMISVYSGSSKKDELMKLIDDMCALEVRFNLITYNAIITSCARFGDGKGTLKWMKRLIDDGFDPDATTYDQVVKALSYAGEAELARNMYIQARDLNFSLSESAYTALSEACKMQGVSIEPKSVELILSDV